jgi:hypothetical protein
LVAIGLLAVPPGQSAGAGRWGPVEKIAATANLDNHGLDNFDPVYSYRRRPALVDVRANESAVIVWIAPSPAPRRLLVSQRSAAGGWRGAQDMSSGLVGQVGAYDLAVGSQGSASVVWSSTQADKSWIEESHRAGGTWSAPVRVGRGNAPLTTIDGSGVTTLAWSHHGVWVTQRTAHGRHWTRPTRIARQQPGQLHLASSRGGDVAAAWLVGSARVVAAVRPRGSSSWTPPATLDTAIYLDSLRLAMDQSGRALAVWSGTADQLRDYTTYVASARSTPRGRWSTTRDLTTRDLGEHGALVDVSMNPDGLAVASWLQIAGGSDGESVLWADRLGSNGTWAAPARVTRGTETWWDVRPWMDSAGAAHLVASRGRHGIWSFSQEPGAAWRGSVLDHGGLIDATGVGRRMVMVFYRNDALRSRILDVR